jgi:hypothetical protein
LLAIARKKKNIKKLRERFFYFFSKAPLPPQKVFFQIFACGWFCRFWRDFGLAQKWLYTVGVFSLCFVELVGVVVYTSDTKKTP